MSGKFIFNNRFKPSSDFKNLSQISFFKSLALLTILFSFLSIAQPRDRDFDPNWKPETEEEISLYFQVHKHLLENPLAFELWKAAENQESWKRAEDWLNESPVAPRNSLESFQSTNRRAEKIKFSSRQIRKYIDFNPSFFGFKFSPQARRELGQNLNIDESYYRALENPARILTRELICESKDKNCYHDISDSTKYKTALIELNDIYDLNNRLTPMTFRELEEILDPSLVNQARILKTSQESESISEENREKNRIELINSLNNISNEYKEQIQSSIENGEYEERWRRIQNDPDNTGEDFFVQRTLLEIEDNQKGIEDQKELLDKSLTTQDLYDQEVGRLQEGIKTKEANIKAYEFKKDVANFQAGIQIVLSVGRMMGAPPEVLQTGEAIYLGFDVMKTIGIMAITGVISPAGLLSAIGTLESFIKVVSGIPSGDQLILEGINDLKRGQVQIFNKLYELEFGINIVQQDLDEVKNILEANAQQTQQGFDAMTVRLNNITEKLDNTAGNLQSGQQSILAEDFTTESESVVAQDQLWNYSISELLDLCNKYGENSNNPAFDRDLYLDCMNVAQTRIATIATQLSDSYIKLDAHASGETFLSDKDLSHVRASDINFDFEENINERMNLIPDMLDMVSGSSFLRNQVFSAEHFSCVQQGEKVAGQYECLSNPYYTDKAFLAYVELSDQLPSPEYLNTLPIYARMDYSSLNQNLENMCTEAHSLTHISELMRHKIQIPINYIEFQVKSIKQSLYNDIRVNVINKVPTILSEISSNHKCHESKKVNNDENDQKNNGNKNKSKQCSLLEDHISVYKDNIGAFLQNQQGMVAFFKDKARDEYFIQRGYAETIETDTCKKGNYFGNGNEDYTRAYLGNKRQKEDFQKTLNRILESGGCLFNDVDDIIGPNFPDQFQLEYHFSLVNRFTRIEVQRNIFPFCFISENTFESIAESSMSVWVGALQGLGILSATEEEGVLYSICQETNLKGSISLRTPSSYRLDSYYTNFPDYKYDYFLIKTRSAQIQGNRRITNTVNSKGVRGLFYQGQPFVNFLDLKQGPISEFSQEEFNFLADRDYTYTSDYVFANRNPETHYNLSNKDYFRYGFYFECTKRACLDYEQKVVGTRKQWAQEANLEMNLITEELKSTIHTSLGNNLNNLAKSMLSLDTIARAGYGHDLSHQENLKNTLTEFQSLLKELSNIATNAPSRLKISAVVNHLNTMEKLLSQIDIKLTLHNDLSGLGSPLDRKSAFEIINRRDHLNPAQCFAGESSDEQ